MKKITFLLFLSAIVYNQSAFSQTTEKMDSLGLPGDNLNLYSVLDLFQKSETFEAFEKSLNAEDSKINNLDLNNDDKTDYIKVIDNQKGESHAVVLQVMVNEKENQDVAVIEIEKDKDGKVVVQIVGNEELYGKDYIVEPTENDPTAKVADTKAAETKTPESEKTVINNTTNNYYNTSLPNTQYVVVNQWPIVHYVYGPSYVVYVSPWYWGYYPGWWHPWSPWYWHNYYWHHHNHHHHHHYGHYHRTSFYRAPIAHNYYGPHRAVSATVSAHRKDNVYHKTYASVNRKGDGKVGAAKANPAYNGKGGNPSNVKRDNKNGGASKSTPNTSKPNRNDNTGGASKSKSNNKPANTSGGNTSRPKNNSSTKASKPAQKSGGASKSSGGASKTGKKGGGGKGR